MGKLLYLNHFIFPYRKTINDSKGFTGKGVATYPNGDVFEGEWVDGLRSCSQGTYTYANLAKPSEEGTQAPAEVYTGSWSNNNKQGIGKQNYNGLGRYFGHCKNVENHEVSFEYFPLLTFCSYRWSEAIGTLEIIRKKD